MATARLASAVSDAPEMQSQNRGGDDTLRRCRGRETHMKASDQMLGTVVPVELHRLHLDFPNWFQSGIFNKSTDGAAGYWNPGELVPILIVHLLPLNLQSFYSVAQYSCEGVEKWLFKQIKKKPFIKLKVEYSHSKTDNT
jgi:hypothetical protein